MEEESNSPEPMGDWLSETKNWIQDNIRIVLSIVMVLVIGAFVYSYSQKGMTEENEETAVEETEEMGAEEAEDQMISQEEAVENQEDRAKVIDDAKKIAQEEAEEKMEEKTEEAPVVEEKKEEPKVEAEKPVETVVSKNEGGYEVAAAQGDSLTTLARSAVKQYLEAGQNSDITNEHRVYMEDYLAKKMGYTHQLKVGEVKSFSTDSVKEALDAARTLTPRELENLKIYSQRVSSF